MRHLNPRGLAASFAACLALSSAPALAALQPLIASTDDPGNWLGASLPVLDGVGAVSLGGGGLCSGSLLAGGSYVLTAAHCVSDEYTGALNLLNYTVKFKGGTDSEVNAVVDTVTIAAGWNGSYNSLGNGSDLALLHLSAPVTSITGYGLSPTLDLGKSFLMAGYGRIGTGAGGADYGSLNVLHYGYNVNDTTQNALESALRAAGYGDYVGAPYPVLYGESYVYDFDNGQAAQNALQRLYGLAGVSFNSDLGQGAGEAMTAPGDSGGGDFVLVDGQYLLSGVHSYGWNPCTDTAHGGISDALADCTNPAAGSSGFGTLGGSTAVYSALPWITSVTGISPVPEPAAWALLLAGLPVLRRLSRQRSA